MTEDPPKTIDGPPDKRSQDEGSSVQRIGRKPNDAPNRGSTYGRDVSFHQASTSTSTLHHRNPVQPRSYVDRDDSRHGTSHEYDSPHHDQSRRRSRSPPIRREVASDRVRTVPWKDLRAPRADQNAKAPVEAPFSKPFTSKPVITAVNKRFANDISRWNRKQSELHASPTNEHPNLSVNPKSISEQPSKQTGSDSPITTRDASLDSTKLSEAELASFDYKDRERVACLLCQRKFKSIDTLHRHEVESQLHKDNLASIETCRQAVGRKLESIAQPGSNDHAPTSGSHPSSTPLPAYRDRASERRAVFGADTPSKHNDTDNRTKIFDGPTATLSTPIPQSAPEKPIDSDNIGSKLLAMMGWSQGQGLGAQREGRTDIVETKFYKPGAGLGSSGAEAPSSQASSVVFMGYVDRVKDREYWLDEEKYKSGLLTERKHWVFEIRCSTAAG